MSLSLFIAPEFRPLFRALDQHRRSLDQSFSEAAADFRSKGISPAVEVTESANGYVLYAELPGVKKENVNISLGDAGRSLTINGRVVHKSEETPSSPSAQPADNTNANANANNTNTTVSEKSNQGVTKGNKLYSERTFVHDSSFSRTVQLPYPVDPSKVNAKLEHGILTITMGKMEDKARSITIE